MDIKPKQEVDLILSGGTAITVDSERRVIRDAGIAITGEEIVSVGKIKEMSEHFRGKKTVDCRYKVIVPGLINAHVHYSHHFSKGLVPDTLGPAVQSNFTHTKASPHLTEEIETWGAKAMLIEMLKTGTTTFMEAGSYYPFEILQSGIEEIGIKGLMGRRASDRESLGHSSLMEPTEKILQLQERLLKEFGQQKLIRPCVTIVGLQRYTDRLVIEAKKMADRYGVLFSLHESAWIDSVNECRKRTGSRPIEYLEKLGVLDENVILVHMLYVNQKEMNILLKRGTKVVHCPSTSIKLGYPLIFGRFPEMIGVGIPVALGSDSSDCSNYHDMVRIMNLAAVLYKGLLFDPEVMGAEQAIEMATIIGAKTLRMEHEIGSLEKGKKADITIFDTNRPEWRPLFNEVQNLVHSANGDSVETVIINGRIVVDKHKILTVDEAEILSRVRSLEQDMMNRTGIPVFSPWKFI
jgi:cytosine/adenosine deaminase-related metal-dependent hydrolase